jgi:hypothetical protein
MASSSLTAGVRKSPAALILAFTVLCGLVGSPSAGAASITIDDFEDAPFSLSASGGDSDVVIQSTPSAIGGFRKAGMTGDGATASTLVLTTTAADDSAIYTVGDGGGVAFSFGLFVQGSPLDPSFDLSAGTAFQVNFSAASSSGEVKVVVQTDVDGNDFEGFGVAPITGAGSVQVPFSSFTRFDDLDFGDVDAINVFIKDVGAGTAYSISSIEVVPEPSATLLLGVGIVGLVLVRQHSRWRH